MPVPRPPVRHAAKQERFNADAGRCTQNTRMGLSPGWSFTAPIAAPLPKPVGVWRGGKEPMHQNGWPGGQQSSPPGASLRQAWHRRSGRQGSKKMEPQMHSRWTQNTRMGGLSPYTKTRKLDTLFERRTSVSDRKKRRSFTREFKLSALERMAETESIVGLAQELGLERKLLYCWRDKYAAGGSDNLRRAGRPSAATAQPSEASRANRHRIRCRTRSADRRTGAQDRPAAVGSGFFSRSLAAGQGTTPDERRAWRNSIYAVIQAKMQQQGNLGIERMCALAGVSRARVLPAMAGIGAAPGGDGVAR